MKQDKSQTTKKYLSRLVTIICIGILFYAAYGLVDIFTDYYQNQKVASDVQETYHNAAYAEDKVAGMHSKESPSPSIRSGFDELLEENPDVVGWITIDDTNIDYPILQSEDNMDYMNLDFNRNETRGGSIFLDYRNDIAEPKRNTIVYGHRMKDGSMFQHLSKFMEGAFFDKHRTFEIETLYDSYEAEIFAVYNTTTDFNYIKTDFSSEEEYDQLLEDIQKESIYQTEVEVDTDDRIITLSTCDYELDENEGRLVVQAKLVKKEQ